MRFGFHISIAQGFSKVVEKAQKTKCETIQLFSRNPRGWKFKALNPDEVGQFKTKLASSNISPCFLHLPYLPNLAATKKELYTKSIDSLCEDLKRAEILSIPFLVIHVGSRVALSEEEAIEKVVQGINESFQRIPNQVMILLENTAGQGTELGSTFSQLQNILSGVEDQSRIGICLDTAHAFAAGYDLFTKNGLDETLNEFDRLIGLKHLHLLHLNDAKTPLASHSDRHWHIGKGYIGLEGFRNIVNHPLLDHLPGIMETPRKDLKDDLRNMRVVRSLMKD
ncbi:MAG: deoxyribonuclease IV [Deltaproteobacteria bacterium]|nr:deoxyribonuclease IV [Deltaproteobacteria bacterium]